MRVLLLVATMKRTGMLRADRTFDEASFAVEFSGIVTSGSTTSIAPQWSLVREWN